MFGYYKLPAGFNSLITAELEQGEKILWQDQPQPYYFSSRSVSNLVGGMIAFCIISIIFFNIFRYTPDLAGIEARVVVLFMVISLIGVVAGISSPLFQYRRLKKTIYLLTNRRAMEIVVRRKPRIHSWPIDSITQIRLKEQTSSLGNVEIVQGVRIIGDDPGEQKGFFHIKRAGEVAHQLNRLTDGRAKIKTQEGKKPVFPTASGNQRLLEEDPSNEKKTFFLKLLDNDLFRLVLVILLPVVLFGTPAAMAWGTNTGKAGFFFFLILFVIYGLINPMRYQAESGHWQTTEGVVEESWIARAHGEDSPRYNPHVLYRYRVGDKVYRENSIDTPGIGDKQVLSKTTAKRKVAPYPEGISVTVYYDPKRPWFSVLEVGKVDHSYWLPVIILLPLLVWSGYHIYSTWPGFESDRFRILWEQGIGSSTKSDGNKYEGELKDGKKHGKGTYTWYDGDKYNAECAPVTPGPVAIDNPGQTYLAYRRVLDAGDTDTARQYLSVMKSDALEGKTDDALLTELRVLHSVTDLTLMGESVEGDRATVSVQGVFMGMTADGTIQMVLERDRWKVWGEQWNLGASPDTGKAAAPGTTLHEAAK